MLKIITVPHPLLTQVSKPVAAIDKRIKNLVKEMEETLEAQKNPEGVGLSAPQIAQSLALFIIKHPTDRKLITFINPEIIETEKIQRTKAEQEEYEDSSLEGCLSIPLIWAPVTRHDKVKVRYQKLDGSTVEEWYSGFMSVVVQHEYDHLQGILFTQRALEQGQPIYKEVNGKLKEIEYA